MADHEQEVFLPEEVDEQIDAYLAASSANEQPADTSARTTIDVLQRHLAPVPQNAALKSVWHRLEQERTLMRQHELARQFATTQQKRRYLMRNIPNENAKERRSALAHRLNLIAAVIFVVLLVGSMAFVLELNSNKSTRTSLSVYTPTPAADAKMFVRIDYTLYRLDMNTHQPLWHLKAPGGPDGSPGSFPLAGQLVQDTYYIVDVYGNKVTLYALNAANGKIQWQVDYDRNLGSPQISNENVYFVEKKDGYITVKALDRNSGTVKWEHPIEKAKLGSKGSMLLLYAVSDKAVYGVLDVSGRQRFALSAQNGESLWNIRDDTFTVSQGFVFDGTLVALMYNGLNVRQTYIQGYNAASGKHLWSKTLDGFPLTDGTAVLNGIIYVSTMRLQWNLGTIIYAFSMKDGALVWQYNDSDKTGTTYPTVTEEGIYLYRNDLSSRPGLITPLVAIDTRTGKERWMKNFEPATFEFPPAADNDRIYVSEPGNVIEIVQALDSKPLGSFKVNDKFDEYQGALVQVVS